MWFWVEIRDFLGEEINEFGIIAEFFYSNSLKSFWLGIKYILICSVLHNFENPFETPMIYKNIPKLATWVTSISLILLAEVNETKIKNYKKLKYLNKNGFTLSS